MVSRQLQIPYIDLKRFKFEAETIKLIPEMISRRYRAIALKEMPDGSLLVGMADATDIFGYDEIAKQVKRPIIQAVVKEVDLIEAIDMAYRRQS